MSRTFSSQFGDQSPSGRVVEDASIALRLELVDSVFQIAEKSESEREACDRVQGRRLYQIMIQSMGIDGASGNPQAGFRAGTEKHIKTLQWARVYDLICRWWSEFPKHLRRSYVDEVNAVLSGHQAAWELRDDGTLHRVLPQAVQAQIHNVFTELHSPQFAAALASLEAAMSAYDARPQRGRDGCKNAMDALESVAKEIYSMPSATFGNVLAEMRKEQPPRVVPETISGLQKIYDLANNHFRHGMTTPFTLSHAEVDFVFVASMAGILLFVRL